MSDIEIFAGVLLKKFETYLMPVSGASLYAAIRDALEEVRKEHEARAWDHMDD